MKTRVITNPYMKNVRHVHYLHMGHTAIHSPCTDKRGIHCEGDRFGYVVDWQISEKKKEAMLVK